MGRERYMRGYKAHVKAIDVVRGSSKHGDNIKQQHTWCGTVCWAPKRIIMALPAPSASIASMAASMAITLLLIAVNKIEL